MADSDLTTEKALMLIAKAQFRPFEKYDYDAFAGVNSPNPLIHYADEEGEEYTIIIDGETVVFVDLDGQEEAFTFYDKNSLF